MPKMVVAARKSPYHRRWGARSEMLEAELSPLWRGRHTLMLQSQGGPPLIGDILRVEKSSGGDGEEMLLTVEVPSVVDTIEDEHGSHYPNDILRHYHFLPSSYGAPFSQQLQDFLSSNQSATWVFDGSQPRSRELDNPVLSIKGVAGFSLLAPDEARLFYVAFQARIDALLAHDGLDHGACQRQKRALYYLADRIIFGHNDAPTGGAHISTTCSCVSSTEWGSTSVQEAPPEY